MSAGGERGGMYTVDASVHISALNPSEADSVESQMFLERTCQQQALLICPTLLLVEVASAVARAVGDAKQAAELAAVLRQWPNQVLVPLDVALAERAAGLAATTRLRGADAVYAAVALEYGATLVTLDQQQLEKLSSVVKTARPADVLRSASG